MPLSLDVIQPAFGAGEVTEALQSREDLAKQQVALKTLRNAIVTSTGSVVNRGGLRKVAEVRDSTYQHRLLPFVFSTEQAYGIELGENSIRIIKDGSLVMRDLVDAAYIWTASGSGTAEYYLELAAGGDPVIIEPSRVLEDSVDMTNGTVGSMTVGQYDWGDNDALGYSTVYVRLSDGADPDAKAQGYVQVPLALSTVYSAGSENSNIDYAQSADVIYFVTPDYKPYKVTRTSDTAWTIEAITFIDGPWLAFSDGDDDITFTPSANSGSGVTITSSDSAGFTDVAVGDQIRMGYENPLDTSIIEWGYATVTGAGTSTTRIVTVNEDFGYEYLLNPDFYDGIAFWDDRSTHLGPSNITHDPVNQRVVLNKGASGEVFLGQTITVAPYERLTLRMTVSVIDTQLNVFIGTTAGGTDVLASQTINSTGDEVFTTSVSTPNASTIFLTVSTLGAPADSTHAISKISLMRKDMATNNHRVSAWSGTRGWPEHVAIFEQALFMANNSDNPDTFWKTKTGEYETYEFHTPPLDTDAVSATLASNQVNAIQWMEPFLELVMGTTGEEWKIQAGANTSTITPTSINAKGKSKTGSASVKPIIAGNSLLFLNRNANKVFVLTYSFDADGYKPSDITVLAPHLLDGHTITEWAYQESPNSVVWAVRDDGVLLGLTYIEEQEIWAWSTHDTQIGSFESVAVIKESGVDTAYFIVKRIAFESSTRVERRYIEKLMPRINDEDIYDWYMVDSGATLDIESGITKDLDITDIVFVNWVDGVTTKWKVWITYTDSVTWATNGNDYIYISGVVGTTELNKKTFRASEHQNNPFGAGKAFILKDKEGDDYINGDKYGVWVSGGEVRRGITEISGLKHLNGRTVNVLADGSSFTELVAPLDEAPTTKWGFTLDAAAIVVHAGLPITTDIETLPHEMILSQTATTQGKKKKLEEITLLVHKSRYARVGSSDDESSMEEITFNDEDSGNNPAELFTGAVSAKIDDSHSLSTQTFIRNDKALPLELVGVISKVDFSEL